MEVGSISTWGLLLGQCLRPRRPRIGHFSRCLLIHQDLPRFTLWLFNIAMENGPFIDGLPGFTY